MPSGSCLCGAVRYRIEGPIGWASHCHCSMCRKAHGTAFASFGRVARADFHYEAGEGHVRSYESSPGVTRTFCGRCGAKLQFSEAASPAFVEVALGTLDDADRVSVDAHIFAASRAPWFEIVDDLPVYDDAPPDADED